MTIRPILRLLSATSLFIMAPPAAAQPGPEAIAQRLLDTLREATAVPGMGAAVWRDGRIMWEGSAGLRDVERDLPVTPATQFRLASVSKLFTATAAAKLAEEGRLDLDSPVQAQLPWLGDRWPTITPRQLAAHISGLPHYRDGDEIFGNRRHATGREAVAIFADRDLLSPPGTGYSYSSWGYTLLGTLVEEKAGLSFPDFVSERLVPGLAICADATHSGNPDASHAYEFDAAKHVAEAPPHDFSYTWGGGGLSGTAGAVASFGGRMIEGRIVAPATFDAMLVPTPIAGGGYAAERDFAVGLGWRIGTDGDGAPHAGAVARGRHGGQPAVQCAVGCGDAADGDDARRALSSGGAGAGSRRLSDKGEALCRHAGRDAGRGDGALPGRSRLVHRHADAGSGDGCAL